MATVASSPRVDALLHLTRRLSKLDPNRLISNIHHIASGDARAPSAWMSIFYDLRELEEVFRNLSQAGHDVSAAYRDFDHLRRWVHAAASTMSHPTPYSPHSPYSLQISTPATPTRSASQRSPMMTSTRSERPRSSPATPPTQSASQRLPVVTSTRPRAHSTNPSSPQQHHRLSKARDTAPAPGRIAHSPNTRAHVRFASTAMVYTIPRYAHES